jgi:hypothetical protein
MQCDDGDVHGGRLMPPHFGECRWWLGLLAVVHVPQIARSIWHSGRSDNPSHVVDPLLCFKQGFKSPVIAIAIARYSCLRKIKLFVFMYNLAVIARYIPI